MDSVPMSHHGSVGLVGRDESIRRLRAGLDEARSGHAFKALISGPPGVGKSAVLGKVRSEATDCTVIFARGIQTESEWAYAGLHQLLLPILGLAERIPGPSKEALSIAIERVGRAPDPMTVGIGVLELFAEAAEEHTLLCVLDDVGFMDQTSRLALSFATRRLHAERVAVLAAQRTVSQRERRWLHGDLDEIDLGPLDVAAEAELLALLAGRPVAADVTEKIHAATGGLPLATREVARSLADSQFAGHDPLPDRLLISSHVHHLFDSYLDVMSEDARRLLLLSAADDSGAAGAIFSAGLELGLDETVADEVERSGLVVLADGTLEFRHPLVRTVVYDSASISERRQVHRALSAAYATKGDEQRRTWHEALATVPPDQRVADDLAATAHFAEERNLHAEASASYELAASLCQSRQSEAELLTHAALSAWRVGELDRALFLVDRAQPAAVGPAVLGRLEHIRGGILLGRGEVATAFEILLSAGERLAGVHADEALAAWSLASEAVSLEGSPSSAAALASVVAATAGENPDPALGFKAKMIIGIGHFFQGDFAPALDTLRLAMEGAVHLSTAADLAAAGRVAFYVGDDDAFLAWNTRALERARLTGTIGQLAVIGGRSGLVELLLGRFDAALVNADESIRLAADTGQPQLGARGLCWSALVNAYRGNSASCLDLVARSLEVAPGAIASMSDAAKWALGALEVTQGDLAAAQEHLGSIDDVGYQVLAGLDWIEAFKDDRRRLAEEMERFSAYAAASGASWAMARSAYGRALLAPHHEAEAAFVESLHHYEHSQRVFERARARLAFGEWLRRQRRRKDARRELHAAAEAFEWLSATPWVERAESELRASGETLRRRDEKSFLDLTSREFQVATLVGEGMTNREVATRLFLSPRTVDHHLRNVFVKMGISSRSELMRLQLVENSVT